MEPVDVCGDEKLKHEVEASSEDEYALSEAEPALPIGEDTRPSSDLNCKCTKMG